MPADQYRTEGVRFIRTSDIADRGGIADDGVYVASMIVGPRHELLEGDLLLSRSGTLGRSLTYTAALGPATFAGYLVRFRPSPSTNSRFLAYATQSTTFQDAVQADAITSTISNFNAEKYSEVRVPWWPLETQGAIAEYLDRETARIDALIAAKERLAELAAERAAVWRLTILTSHLERGVTVPLKSVARWVEGPGIMAADFAEDGVPLLRIRNLVDDTINLEGCGFVSPDLARTRWNHLRVRSGELLVSGSARSGSPVVVPQIADGAIPYTGLIRIWPRGGDLLRDYLRLFLASPLFDDQIDRLKTGVGLQHWGPYHLAQVRIPKPQLDVQSDAVAEFRMREATHRQLRVDIVRQIALMREHRQALITAAVTGELDLPEAA